MLPGDWAASTLWGLGEPQRPFACYLSGLQACFWCPTCSLRMAAETQALLMWPE